MRNNIYLALVASLFTGCAATSPSGNGELPKQMTVPNSEYMTVSAKYQGRPVYRVWYGTNRAPIDPSNPNKGYGDQRDTKVNYGTCIVEIPKSHEFGSTGSSWLRRWITFTDDRIKLREVEAMSKAKFFDFVRYKLGTRLMGERDALIYVHGFNVDFEEAAIRAAQIGFDLKVNGITTFFSWPSKGSASPAAYVADGTTISSSEHHLEEFIRTILDNPDVERVNLLAHSMGNKALLRVMERISASIGPSIRGRVSQIILAAPDVDIDEFRQLAKVYPNVANRTTLYISSKDLALKSSGIINDYPRAGFVPPIMTLQGIDTIEVSDIDLTLLGHSYFAEAEAVLYDMFDLLNSGRSPQHRIRLRKEKTNDGREFWVIRP